MWFRRRDKKVSEDSQAALTDARKNLAEIEKRGPEVTEVAAALKKLRERNHFAEQLEELIVRRRGQTR